MITEELPGMPPPTSLREGSNAWKLAEFARFRSLSVEEGGLTQPFFASLLLGISRQRVHQLIEQGKLRGFKVMGKFFVSCNGLEEFRHLERNVPGMRFRYEEVAA